MIGFLLSIGIPAVALAATINCPTSGLCEGTGYDDTIYGNANYNNIEAYGGSDVAYGYATGDQMHGADGYDTMRGGNDNDTIYGGKNGQYGWDNLHGGAGHDVLDDSWGPSTNGTVEFDRACGGDGSDSIDVRDANGRTALEADQYFGGAGTDTITKDVGVDTQTDQTTCNNN